MKEFWKIIYICWSYDQKSNGFLVFLGTQYRYPRHPTLITDYRQSLGSHYRHYICLPFSMIKWKCWSLWLQTCCGIVSQQCLSPCFLELFKHKWRKKTQGELANCLTEILLENGHSVGGAGVVTDVFKTCADVRSLLLCNRAKDQSRWLATVSVHVSYFHASRKWQSVKVSFELFCFKVDFTNNTT